MKDRYLQSVTRAAQRIEHCPPLRLLTHSGPVIVGTPAPAPAEDFMDASGEQIRRNLLARYRDGEQRARAAEGALGDQAADEEDVLALAPARLSFSGEADGLSLPAVRVPLDGISAWWVAAGQPIKAPRELNVRVGVAVAALFDP